MGRLRVELVFWSVVFVAALAVAFAFAVVQGAWIVAGFTGLIGLVTVRSLLRTSKIVRHLDFENLPDAPLVAGEPSEAMAAVEELDELVSKASGVPLTDQVRLDRRQAYVLLDRLRAALSQGPAEPAAMVDELDEFFRQAKPVPLTDQIRVGRAEIYDVLDRMRASASAKDRVDVGEVDES
jgi:hypothetical protein